jgi:undecaprenyl-diphosphatase
MSDLALRLVGFVSRHRWSLTLSGLSAVCFAYLASELREGELNDFDRAVSTAVVAARGSLDSPMYWLTRLGDGRSLTAIVLFVATLCVFLRRQREACFVLLVGGGAWTWIFLLKQFFQRSRPDVTQLYVLSSPHSFSFPSGHAFGATVVLLALVVATRAFGLRGAALVGATVCALLTATGVAVSRVYFGVHFPSDVLAGMFAGAAWVAAVTGLFYPAALPGEHARQEVDDGSGARDDDESHFQYRR